MFTGHQSLTLFQGEQSSISYYFSDFSAETLPRAALTARNSLYSIKALKLRDTVLVQGTGGAEFISTTSDARIEEVLKRLGAQHVINYKINLEWSQAAKDMSLGASGTEYTIELGGPTTKGQLSIVATIDGIIAVIGNPWRIRGGERGCTPKVGHGQTHHGWDRCYS
jgi:NADPH:quinone reductase-like Zn-dependent oxidoreductase